MSNTPFSPPLDKPAADAPRQAWLPFALVAVALLVSLLDRGVTVLSLDAEQGRVLLSWLALSWLSEALLIGALVLLFSLYALHRHRWVGHRRPALLLGLFGLLYALAQYGLSKSVFPLISDWLNGTYAVGAGALDYLMRDAVLALISVCYTLPPLWISLHLMRRDALRSERPVPCGGLALALGLGLLFALFNHTLNQAISILVGLSLNSAIDLPLSMLAGAYLSAAVVVLAAWRRLPASLPPPPLSRLVVAAALLALAWLACATLGAFVVTLLRYAAGASSELPLMAALLLLLLPLLGWLSGRVAGRLARPT